jgi:hypothetical protein
MTGVGWYRQQISLNFLNLVKFYICKPKSTGRGSLIKKQTIVVMVTFFFSVVGQKSKCLFNNIHTGMPFVRKTHGVCPCS